MNIPVDQDAPVRSEGVIEISAPVEAVWAVLTGIEEWPRWQEDVTRATLQDELTEGAEFRWKASGIPFRSRIHTLVEERMLGWTGKTFGVSAVHNWTFESHGGTTTVTVQESLQGPLPRFFTSSFQKTLDAGIRKSLEELKSASEGRD